MMTQMSTPNGMTMIQGGLTKSYQTLLNLSQVNLENTTKCLKLTVLLGLMMACST